MNYKTTFGNNILIRLDRANDFVKLKNGTDLYIDTSYEPEKHTTVTGEVFGIPKKLLYTGIPNIGMPWKTPMEVKIGDRVVVYYLSILNALGVYNKDGQQKSMKAFVEGDDKYVLIEYQNIFAIIRDGVMMPINGYCLIEPMEDPEWTRTKKRITNAGLIPLKMKEKTNTHVVYGIVRYCGRPNEAYVDNHSDDGVAVNPGDIVIMKRISDLPLEYDLHAKIDGGKKYWRIQRRKILAVYEKPV